MNFCHASLAFAFSLRTFCFCSAQTTITSLEAPYPTLGTIERSSPEFEELIAPGAKIEVLAEGFRWSEGPVWDKANSRLIFNDVPENTAYVWTEKDGVSIYLKPSGHTEMHPEGFREPGANGLAFSPDGRLVLCQHGNQQIALYDESDHSFTTLVDSYGERDFYSPNDLVYASNGDLYFTDPPYGLPREKHSEIETHYVYRLSSDGEVSQVTDTIRYPNGIGLSPDNRTLYIASSDYRSPAVYAFALDSAGEPTGDSTVIFDATAYHSENRRGGCDGLAVDKLGNIWTTGPSGVYVLAPDGELLGFINTGGALANCAFGGPDGSTLYITAAKKLLRIETLITGLQYDRY